ncbi:tyrosine-type recombinase/integrase [Roseateles sp.]|uniref:tyrosine-type recombinase/integrase n=1 Tax=Roseateles sp. TaxID=1971397 RepID=UPI002E07682B|nr:tyrosine-type recombinase/integrase [Roseateles sp.]HEV6968111.1 tyrosine-type recombinase/integrase [Roseateles sp.]
MGSVTKTQRVEKATGRKITVFRAYIRRAGVSKSKVFDSASAAKAWLRENEHGGALAAAAASKKGTLAALIEDFIKAPADRGSKFYELSHLDFWKQELGHLPVAEVTRGAINQAKAKLHTRPVYRNSYAGGAQPTSRTIGAATINRYLSSLSSVFNYAVKFEIIDDHPMKAGKVEKLPENGGRRRILTADEEARLMQAAAASKWPMLALFVRMCLTTAARKSEVLNLRWEQIQLDDSVAVLGTTKNGRARAMPLVQDVRQALEAAKKVRPLRGDFVFFDPKNPEQPKNIDSVWKTCRKAAGLLNDRDDPLERVVLHSTRHTAVTRMLKGGANLAQAAAVSGHQTLAMLRRYEHLAAEDAVQVAQRLLAGDAGK